MDLFRGYILTNNKTPLQEFKLEKNVPLLELEEAQRYPEYAGVLAQNTVLIDIDDEAQAQRLFDMVKRFDLCCQVRKTTRGMHFYFKNDGTWDKCTNRNKVAIGLKADFKIGTKNCYALLRKDGLDRHVIYDEVDLFDDYDAPPFWLKPVETKMELFGLGEGGGRNGALFGYMLPLQQAGFTKEQSREIARLINENIFSTPLPEGEMETILRDEAFEKALVPNFFDGKAFKFDEFANYMIREFHIKRINGKLHLYENGIYRDDEKLFHNKMRGIISNLTDARRTEVMKYIDISVLEEASLGKARYIAFKNGILDVDTGDMLPFSPDVVVVNQIPWDYREGAKSELVEGTLTKLACGDKEIRSLLEEMVGYCMYRRNELRKAFLLTGDRGNGKSTFLDVIKCMLGNENVSHLDLKDLNHTFRPAELFGKLANLGDDIDNEFIRDTSVFKKFVSGDPVTVERKNRDPFSFVNYAKIVLSANDIPRMSDRTGAVVDRLIIVPFNARFTKNDPDYRPFIKDELKERGNIEALIVLGVEGLKRVLKFGGFTTSQVVEEQRKEFDLANNPIKGFFMDVVAEDVDAVTREPVGEWYKRYQEYCLVNQLTPMANSAFSKSMMTEFGLVGVRRKIDGKTVRFYQKI